MLHWLVGPSGSGKSTVGKKLAELRSALFVDLDKRIEAEAGRSVAEIFAEQGEEGFRRIERAALLGVVESEKKKRIVVATGGGTVIDPHNRDVMRSTGVRVLLKVDPETAVERLRQADDRPLLKSHAGSSRSDSELKAVWRQMLRDRHEAYADHDLAIDGTGSIDHVAGRIVAALGKFHASSWSIKAQLNAETSKVYALRSPYSTIRAIRRLTRFSRRFVLTDDNLFTHYERTLQRIAGPNGVVVVVKPGEGSKSFESVAEIVLRLQQEGFTRGDCIVGFGGGVVTDLAGFVASIYMRGIRCIAVPTSLLAMVDASVGGKTAINAAGTRNLVGTFRQPTNVLICDGFLRTLPIRELRSGMVEALKMGVSLNKRLHSLVVQATPQTTAGTLSTLIPEIIRESISVKLWWIKDDVRDDSRRGILNFGHTFGHALEAFAPDVYTHGEAVAFGMIAAAEMAGDAQSSFAIEQEQMERIARAALPYTCAPNATIDFEALLQKMYGDKKRSTQGLRFVLPTKGKGGEDGRLFWTIRMQSNDKLIIAAMERAWERIVHYHRSNTK